VTHAKVAAVDPPAAVTSAAGQTGRRLYPVPDPGDVAELMAAQVARARAWLPVVDPAVFDCYLGTLATRIEPYTEADPVGVMVSLLGAAGVHVGQGPHLPIGMERHPLMVWPMLIGHTGSGRKGTAWGAAKQLLTTADTEFVAANVHSGLSSGEGLAAVFATDPNSEPVGGKGKRPRLLPDGDCRLLAYEPEWASVMARMKREGNTLSATLRAAWEGGNLSTLNVDARVARKGHVGILAHITPGEFKAKVSSSDMSGGTYNRFLPVAVGQSKFLHLPTPPDAELMAQLGASLAERLEQAGGYGALAFSADARDVWAGLYLEFGTLPEDEHGSAQLAEFTSRAAPHCLRIAALYAALDRTPLIQPEHLASAAALVRYSIASAAAVLRPTRELADLAAWIGAAGEQGRTRTEITTGYFKGKPPADMAALLDRLVQADQVTTTERPRPDGKGGRKATIYTATHPNTANFRT
jgi:hypothetical protein